MLMPFEWDVRVSSKDHTVTASTSETIRPPSGYTTLRDSTSIPRSWESRATASRPQSTSSNRPDLISTRLNVRFLAGDRARSALPCARVRLTGPVQDSGGAHQPRAR